MADGATTTLTPAQHDALKHVAAYRFYFWKPKMMEKLAALGLVARVPEQDRAGQIAYRITEAGSEHLANG